MLQKNFNFRIHSLNDIRQEGLDRDGDPLSDKLYGPNDEDFGYEWAAHCYDTLDESVDLLLRELEQVKIEILDIGCARGARANQFVRDGWHVTGADVTNYSSSIDKYNEQLRSIDLPAISFHQGDIFDLANNKQFKNRFDLVTIRRLIHFYDLIQIQQFFDHVQGMVKRGGHLAVCFMSPSESEGYAQLYISERGAWPSLVSPYSPNSYDHHFSEIYHLAVDAGFVVTDAFGGGRLSRTGFIAKRPQNTRASPPTPRLRRTLGLLIRCAHKQT